MNRTNIYSTGTKTAAATSTVSARTGGAMAVSQPANSVYSYTKEAAPGEVRLAEQQAEQASQEGQEKAAAFGFTMQDLLTNAGWWPVIITGIIMLSIFGAQRGR